MTIEPVLAAVLGTAATLLIALLGYFLNRTLIKQDERNAEQSEINKELRTCFDTLNTTLAEILVDNRWRKEVCADRHQQIEKKFKELNKS
jgi:hypothetical protein